MVERGGPCAAGFGSANRVVEWGTSDQWEDVRAASRSSGVRSRCRVTRVRRLRCRRRLHSGPPRSIRRCRNAASGDAPRQRDASSRFVGHASLRTGATRSECGDSAPLRQGSGEGAASATGPRLASRVARPATAHLTHAPPRRDSVASRWRPRSAVTRLPQCPNKAERIPANRRRIKKTGDRSPVLIDATATCFTPRRRRPPTPAPRRVWLLRSEASRPPVQAASRAAARCDTRDRYPPGSGGRR